MVSKVCVPTRERGNEKAELVLMEMLVSLLKKRAQGRGISGLSAYE